MSTAQIGDTLIDNDPRMRQRELTVVDILPNGVRAMDSAGRYFTYLTRRVHMDGKPRKSGMTLRRKDPA